MRVCHDLLWATVTDLGRRQATPLDGSADDWWQSGETLHRYLAGHAAEWWVAEDPGATEIIGYARSIERGGLFELTELFVRPGRQSKGIGRALLDRAFPAGRGAVRALLATGDVRALARYHTTGLVVRFPILTLEAAPGTLELAPDGVDRDGDEITPSRIDGDADLATVVELERAVVGYAREGEELRWLAGDREGHLYRRGDRPIGFAFVGASGSGPIAALEPKDLPAILLHVEDRARTIGMERLEFEIPSPNEVAIRHLLRRGYRFNPWINYFMSDRPFGRFDRFVSFSPPIFL